MFAGSSRAPWCRMPRCGAPAKRVKPIQRMFLHTLLWYGALTQILLLSLLYMSTQSHHLERLAALKHAVQRLQAGQLHRRPVARALPGGRQKSPAAAVEACGIAQSHGAGRTFRCQQGRPEECGETTVQARHVKPRSLLTPAHLRAGMTTCCTVHCRCCGTGGCCCWCCCFWAGSAPCCSSLPLAAATSCCCSSPSPPPPRTPSKLLQLATAAAAASAMLGCTRYSSASACKPAVFGEECVCGGGLGVSGGAES